MLELLKNFPTKEEMKISTDHNKQAVLNGDVDVIKYYALGKYLEIYAKESIGDKDIKACLLNAANKYTEKEFEAFGCIFKKQNIGKGTNTWDYTDCNDTELDDLLLQKEELDKKIKERQKFLQGLTTEMEVYNKEGVRLNKPKNNSEFGVVVELKK